MVAVHTLLESLNSPQKIVARGSSESLTAEMLLARCTRLARELSEQNITVLALHGDNSIDWMILDFACQLADVCLIPVPTFFSTEQIEHVFTTVPVDAIMSEQPDIFFPMLPGRDRKNTSTSIGRYRLMLLGAAENDISLPENTGKITFTSGSTGRPKGVCLSNQQLIKHARALVEAVGLQQPRHLCLLPLSTLLENVGGVYAPLLAGGEIILPSLSEIGFEGSSSLNPQVFVDIIKRYRPDSIILTPQLLTVLVSAAKAGWQPPSSLKFVAVGGGKVSRKLLTQSHQLGIPAYEGYGLSECASVVCLNSAANQKDGSCGKPLSHLTIEIEDGEIVVSGNAMLGYVGEPSSWGKERVFTGDLGSVDADGFLQISGRKKNLLISSYGRNINPEWVESELLAQPAIAECVVFGEARPYCVALVSAGRADESTDSLQRIIDETNSQLPDYARVKKWQRLPRMLCTQDDLMTDNGRPRRAAIAARYAQLIESLYPHQTTENQ
jgi:long-chain acyl-CoA synthetase